MNIRYSIIKYSLKLAGDRTLKQKEEIKDLIEYDFQKKKEYQVNQLTQLLEHAYAHVPYYKELFDTVGIVTVNNGKTSVDVSKFHSLPELNKSIIRDAGDLLYSDDRENRGSYENSSGGSTGEPVKFIQDKEYDSLNNATKIFFNERLGKLPGEPEVKLWGSDRDIIQGNLTLKDRLINYIYNRKFYNCYDFNKENIQGLIRLHNSFKPRSYWAYVDAMTEFAKYINTNHVSLYSPSHIITSIGPLYEDAKREIEKAFNCDVYNQYGSREVGVGAIDSPHGKYMDVFFWRLLLEIVPRDTNSKEGKLLITTLNNYSMPLIRYEIGDVALPSTEPESYAEIGGVKSYFKIHQVIGRTLGFFKKSNGALVHTHFMVQQMFFRKWIRQFQLIQKDYEHIICRLVVREGMSAPEEELDDIKSKIAILIGNDTTVDFEFVEKIEPSASGKVVYTICQVQ